MNSKIQLLLSKVQGEPGLPGPADATVAEAETSPPQATSPLQTAVELWERIWGIDQLAATSLVAEIGANMDQFPISRRLKKVSKFTIFDILFSAICKPRGMTENTSLF